MNTNTSILRIFALCSICWLIVLCLAACESDAGRQDSHEKSFKIQQQALTLESYLPDEFVVGEHVLGLEILAVEGDTIKLENPFIHRQMVAVTPDGSLTGIYCDGASYYQPPIEVELYGYSLPQIADVLHGAFFGAASQAMGTYLGTPDMGYCSTYNTNPIFGANWYQTPGELKEYQAVWSTSCEAGEEYEACEAKRCSGMAAFERVWAQRRVYRYLNDDVAIKLNVSLFLLYSHVIATEQSPQDEPIINWYRETIIASYDMGDANQTDITQKMIGEPEVDFAECLAAITSGSSTGTTPMPNCSFNFGYGPVSVSVATDGTISITGGEGLIVGVSLNPKTNKVSVTLAAGLQGHIGPVGVSGSVGVEFSVQDGIQNASDISLDAGPLSCSINQ